MRAFSGASWCGEGSLSGGDYPVVKGVKGCSEDKTATTNGQQATVMSRRLMDTAQWLDKDGKQHRLGLGKSGSSKVRTGEDVVGK